MPTPFQQDVFLSHNSADKPTVETLAKKLIDAGLDPWLDKWNLIPGEPWQEGLEEALHACQTVAIFLGPGGISPWENEEMRSALEERVQDKSRRVIPVLLPGAPDPEDQLLPRFLRRLTWVDFRNGLDDDNAFRQLVSGIKGVAPGPMADPLRPPGRASDVIARLEHFNLRDDTDPDFGKVDFIKDLLQVKRSFKPTSYDEITRATSYTIFLAIPLMSVKVNPITNIKTARELFQPNRWYDHNRPGPRYCAEQIFPLGNVKIRTTRTELITETIYERPDDKLLVDALRVNQYGEVVYATSLHTFDEFTEGVRIFRLGAIINILWSFLCLVWELYENIGYQGGVHACVAMVNTKDSFLGHFAAGRPDPYDRKYWNPITQDSGDEVCRDNNILVCREVDFATFQRKIEPEVIYHIAEEIALAYNQYEARCFDRKTERLMRFKFRY